MELMQLIISIIGRKKSVSYDQVWKQIQKYNCFSSGECESCFNMLLHCDIIKKSDDSGFELSLEYRCVF